MSRGEINDAEVFRTGQQAGGDADSFVVAQTGARNRQKITFKHNFAVDGRVRFVHEEKKHQRAADQGDVKRAAGKAQPRGVVLSGQQEVDDDGNDESRDGKAEADDAFSSIHRKEGRVDRGDEQEKGRQRQTHFGHQ